MRGRLLLGALLAILGLTAWLIVRHAPEPPSHGSPAGAQGSSSRAASVFRTLLHAAPAPSEETRLAIRGTVLGAQGPVAGAVVLASAPVPRESLSELPCNDRFSYVPLLQCASDFNEEPLLTLVAQRQGEVPVHARATTAADGSFELEGLEAGPYMLWVESPEGAGLRHDVAAGSGGVELRLGKGVRLQGTVSDETKAPVAGALVTAIFKAHSRFFETLADEQGNFRLGPLPPGEYVFIIAREGLRTSIDSFTVYAGEVKWKPVLYHPRRLAGRVLLEGAPAQGVEVHARGLVNQTEVKTTSDAAGRFSFEGLTPMRYELTATRDGHGTVVEVELDAKELEHEEITLALTPAVQVQGVVRDTDQQPIAGAWVQVLSPEDSGALALSAYTDKEGRYRIGPLPPGLLTFNIFLAEGYVDPGEQEHVLSAGAHTVDFTLEPENKVFVEGVVVDAEGQPIQGETLDLRTLAGEDASFVVRGVSGKDGSFALAADTPGRYLLQVVRQGEKLRELEVLAPSTQRIVNEPFPRVEGEVVDEEGIPMPGVALGLWPATSEAIQDRVESGSTDSLGHFVLQAPVAGRYRVSAELGRGDFVRTASQAVELGGKPVRLQLRFEAGRSLSGVVVDRRGRPIPGATVVAKSPLQVQMDGCGPSIRGVTTGPDGRFTFEQLTGETFLLEAKKDAYSLDTSQESGHGGVRVSPGDQNARIVLVRNATLRGRVVHADGSPIQRFSLNGTELENAQGVFSLSLRRTGKVALELSAPGLGTVKRAVSVHEEEDVDLGPISLGP